MKILLSILIFFFSIKINAQNFITTFPYFENFDTVTAPLIPYGWTTSILKSTTGDFTTTTSVPYSTPQAIISTDSKIAQWIKSPRLSFIGKIPDKIEFYERRSATHNSGLIIEYSVGSDTTYIQIGDTLKNISANYIKRTIQLPSSLQEKQNISFRLRIVGNGTGNTATIRFDDFSITVKKLIDLGLQSFSLTPINIVVSDSISIKIFIKNFGASGNKLFQLKLLNDKNRDSLFSENEIIKTLNYQYQILENDSISVQFGITNLLQGNNFLKLQLIIDGDEDLQNNFLIFNIEVGSKLNSLIINEVMYDPVSTSCEYIELLNTSTSQISFIGWTITDTPTPSGNKNMIRISGSVKIEPNSFLIISADSTIFNIFPMLRNKSSLYIINKELSLSNSGDDIVLRDNIGNLIDSIRYNSNWHRNISPHGRSLEKIVSTTSGTTSNNWSTSVNINGGTPGEKNSIVVSSPSTEEELSVFPNPFSPDGDGFEDFTIISYSIKSSTVNIRARVFDRRGYLIRSLANNDATTSIGTLIWDGFNDEKEKIRIGAYILLFEATDQLGKSVMQSKKVIVVAKRF